MNSRRSGRPQSYCTSLEQLRRNHSKIFSKTRVYGIARRSIAGAKHVLVECIYREHLDNQETKEDLAKIFTRLLTLYPSTGVNNPWELCKRKSELVFKLLGY